MLANLRALPGAALQVDGARYAEEAAVLAATHPPGSAAATHPLAGIALQRRLESGAYTLGGSSYEAPGQLVADFLAGKPSTDFASVQPSYKPGVKLGDLAPSLPDYAIAAIRESFEELGILLARGADGSHPDSAAIAALDEGEKVKRITGLIDAEEPTPPAPRTPIDDLLT